MVNIPLIVYIGMSILGLGISIGKHGESKGKHNGWTSLIATIIEILLVLWAVGWSLS